MDPNRDEPMNYNPQRIAPKGPYQFSPEETRVMKECNKESFYKRCVPISSVLGFGTYFAIQSGHLRPNPRFGASPKVTVAVIIGYFLGKISYQPKCAEKLMQLPNSQIGEMLRQRRKGNLQETMEPGIGPGMGLAPFSNMPSQDTYSDISAGPSDIDTTRRPDIHGLDDSQRPTLDNPIYEEEMPPVHKTVTSYDELRRQNREEFAQKRTPGYSSSSSNSVTQTNIPQRAAPVERAEPQQRVRTNIYGDPIG